MGCRVGPAFGPFGPKTDQSALNGSPHWSCHKAAQFCGSRYHQTPLVWKWSKDGRHSSNSCYAHFFREQSSRLEIKLENLSTSMGKVLRLTGNDRYWTSECLARQTAACFHGNQSIGTMGHLLVDCPFL